MDFHHDDLETRLQAAGAGIGAAELHGSLVGYLCLGRRELGQFLSDAALADGEVFGDLFAASRQALDEGEGIEPLLPDDSVAIPDRALALRRWCGGFLGGLGLGGLDKSVALSADVQELLSDLREISRTEVSFDADEEADESALMELTEYVRMGVILLRDELGVRR